MTGCAMARTSTPGASCVSTGIHWMVWLISRMVLFISGCVQSVEGFVAVSVAPQRCSARRGMILTVCAITAMGLFVSGIARCVLVNS